MDVLRVEGLTKRFSEKRTFWGSIKKEACTAVSDVSFSISQGETLGLLGPNGSGKTTIIHMLLSVLSPTAGKILYFGKDLQIHRSAILQHVGFASTYVKLPPRLTVKDNLDIYGRLFGLSYNARASKIEQYLKFFGIFSLKDRPVGVLSAGEATRVMLVKAFLADPKVVLLDEPTASLDPDAAYDIRNFIVSQQREFGVSFLLTSHNMAEVTQMCSRVLFLKKGSIIADNNPNYLAQTIARAHIQLGIQQGLERTIPYVLTLGCSYTLIEQGIEIEIDECRIAHFLMLLARADIDYSFISIKKPTLEDFFVHVIKLKDSHGVLPGVGNNPPPPAPHSA